MKFHLQCCFHQWNLRETVFPHLHYH